MEIIAPGCQRRGEPVLGGAKLGRLQKQFLDKCPGELFHFLNSWVPSHVQSKNMIQGERMDKDRRLCKLNNFL